MKAIRVHEQSGVDGLVFEDAPDPVTRGRRRAGPASTPPASPGASCTGRSTSTGRAATGHGHHPGPRTLGRGRRRSAYGTAGDLGGRRGLRPHRRLPRRRRGRARRGRAAARPEADDDRPVHAATLPQAGLTSWQAKFVHGGLQPGGPSSCTAPPARWARSRSSSRAEPVPTYRHRSGEGARPGARARRRPNSSTSNARTGHRRDRPRRSRVRHHRRRRRRALGSRW